LGATLNGSVRADVFYARVRRFESALQASLDNDNIPVAVYDRLIEVVHTFLPALNRYLKLRKKMLGLEELHLYDLYTPLIPEYQKNVEYEEAKGLVLEGLAPLGEAYLDVVKNGFENGWVDVCENEGKTGGNSWEATISMSLRQLSSAASNIKTGSKWRPPRRNSPTTRVISPRSTSYRLYS
jgi:oligoendopeptidase F